MSRFPYDPAFPMPLKRGEYEGRRKHRRFRHPEYYEGITLHQWFAGLAVAGFAGPGLTESHEAVAQAALKLADALVVEYAKRELVAQAIAKKEYEEAHKGDNE